MADPLLELEHVALRYDNGTQALEDVSLAVASGEHVCVLGSNGSGKSTLASVLCGLLAPDDGSVSLLGDKVFDAGRAEPIDFDAYRHVRRHLGLVFQNPDDQLVTTVVEEDVAFGPENLGLDPGEIGQRVERELRRVALTDFAKADPTRLSGGQKQRVAIAGVLAMEPRVLILDEPGALLDVRGRTAIMRVMRRLRADGTTVVHITHFMEEALEADRVVVMSAGRIVLEGTPGEVFSQGERIAQLGLEEPFAGRLSAALRRHGADIAWTCGEEELMAALRRHAGTRGTPPSAGGPSQGPSPDASHGLCAVGTDIAYSLPASGTGSAAPADTSSAPPAITCEHVSFSYDRTRTALDNVSFAVARGESVSIVGHTGSGKSTLLRLLCALDAPDKGTVRVRGIDTAHKRDRRRLHGTIGYVMQHPERQLFAETVIKDVAFGPKNLGLPPTEVDERCRRALGLVGLAGLDDASPFELSGGQQRLCALAGILAMQPDILVLDEPTAGLDPRGRRQLRAILDDIHAHGVTLVQVTHNMDDAARTEHVVVLDHGRVLFAGPPHEVFCRGHARGLAEAGLGLPPALDWAYRLDEDASWLGDPLTLDELAHTLAQALGPTPEPAPPAASENGEADHGA